MEAFPQIPDWVALEHSVAQILTQQELHGWKFNEQKAQQLESSLRREMEELTAVLRRQHPFVAGTVFTPKRNNRTQGYFEGCESTRIKQLNTTSRDHISWILQTHYGWTPTLISSKNEKPVIDEVVLKEIGTDIALRFLRCLDLKKQLGMISEGVNAWQKLCTKSRIHHHCSVATNTHRCAHRKPNLAQVPQTHEFRELFTASPGLTMVAADLSGIELRMLAHYLARYDRGRYTKILTTGDIHAENAERIGITRRQVKTVTYAFLYGAGDLKIGISFDSGLSENKARKKGKEIREAYVQAIPGLAELLAAIKTASKRGFVKAIDGRKILLDSPHKALNYLLQSSAGTIAKRWLYIAHQGKPESVQQLAFIHDEIQYECDPKDVKDMKFLLELSAVQAGEYYNLRCPIAAESKSGANWAETH
jgi:DNA polymerase I-like protein with 3'-5' exonuclease and polymerase domains